MIEETFYWFRRDLRLKDNAGLYHALKKNSSVAPVFIFDKNILAKLKAEDTRVTFLFDQIQKLKSELNELGSDLIVEYGDPAEIWKKLLNQTKSPKIYVNKDYEPYARERDKGIKKLVEEKNGTFHSYKDHVVFEENEILKADGKPYTVFTPYSRKWMEKLTEESVKPYPNQEYYAHFFKANTPSAIGSLSDMGFIRTEIRIPHIDVEPEVIQNYDKTRDIPALVGGTSRLGVHFRFGTISIRSWGASAWQLNQTFLSELCWRDFYQQILWHFPQVVNHSFKSKYEKIEWRNNKAEFEKWCNGTTGYPLVDAGMRQLNETGYMHNRVRMVTASFLCKHLLIDWRWGEQYFAEKLLDYDLGANNGGWQWSAGTGCDAAPYFRVFNPESQQKKFDPKFEYIQKWVPEYGTPDYPLPMVDHKQARERALFTYKSGLSVEA